MGWRRGQPDLVAKVCLDMLSDFRLREFDEPATGMAGRPPRCGRRHCPASSPGRQQHIRDLLFWASRILAFMRSELSFT